jgi:hypothetical protein
LASKEMEPVAMEGLETKRQTVFDEWKEMLSSRSYAPGQGHILIAYDDEGKRLEINVAPPKELRKIVMIEHEPIPDASTPEGGVIRYYGRNAEGKIFSEPFIQRWLSLEKYEEWKKKIEDYMDIE